MKHQYNYEIIVVGLGANGSSALWHLSRAGKKVLGIDRFQPPHTKGSSHGESRIIRQAYHESPVYVPLVKAAYPLWAELEKAAGKELFLKTGGLLLGEADSAVVKGALLSAKTHDIPFEWLQSADISRRFPMFRPTAATVGLLEHEAGILYPEECVRAFLTLAAHNGATIRTNEPVVSITPLNGGITVTTTTATYHAEKCIVSTGAWLTELLPELHLPLTVRRQPLFWFGNGGQVFRPAAMPIFIWEYAKDKMFYGFPDLGHGVKLAPHHGGREIHPDQLRADVTNGEIAHITSLAGTWLNFDPAFLKACTCLYTNTPDEHFIIGFHPRHPNILIASPCSGHGFKFSSLTGRILSDLAITGHSSFDLSPFAIHRFIR